MPLNIVFLRPQKLLSTKTLLLKHYYRRQGFGRSFRSGGGQFGAKFFAKFAAKFFAKFSALFAGLVRAKNFSKNFSPKFP